MEDSRSFVMQQFSQASHLGTVKRTSRNALEIQGSWEVSFGGEGGSKKFSTSVPTTPFFSSFSNLHTTMQQRGRIQSGKRPKQAESKQAEYPNCSVRFCSAHSLVAQVWQQLLSKSHHVRVCIAYSDFEAAGRANMCRLCSKRDIARPRRSWLLDSKSCRTDFEPLRHTGTLLRNSVFISPWLSFGLQSFLARPWAANRWRKPERPWTKVRSTSRHGWPGMGDGEPLDGSNPDLLGSFLGAVGTPFVCFKANIAVFTEVLGVYTTRLSPVVKIMFGRK